MKIVFLQDDFPPQSFGGAGFSTYDLAVGMKKAGHEVFVITTCRSRDEAGESNYHGLKVFRIASDYHARWRAYLSVYNPRAVRQAKELLKKIEPDIAHINNVHFYLSYHCFALAKKYARRVVFTARDVMSFNFGKLQTRQYIEYFDYRTTWRDHLKQAKSRWNPLRNFFIKKYLTYADRIFAVSDALRRALEQNGITHAEVMHTGIDTALWRAGTEGAARFRIEHGMEDKKVILFGGRLNEAKGGGKTLEAMAAIVKDVPDAVLLVIGKIDGYTDEMRKKAGELGIEKNLVFTGWMERAEMKNAYASADVVLVPSICFDSLPRVVLEAMASGRPVIGTCYGGAKEVVVDGITGYIVNPMHPQEISGRAIDLLKNPKKAETFGKAGYERMRTEFDLDEKVSRTLSWYQGLLSTDSN